MFTEPTFSHHKIKSPNTVLGKKLYNFYDQQIYNAHEGREMKIDKTIHLGEHFEKNIVEL